MNDKLTAGMLRDLADIIANRNRNPHFKVEVIPSVFREEAARREAEAKPGWCAPDDACPHPARCREATSCLSDEAPAASVEGLVAHAEVTADGELRLMAEEPEYTPPTFCYRETWEVVALAMNQTADLLLNQNDPRYALLHEFANKLGERSEELKEYAKTLPFQSDRDDEADQPAAPAPADDLVAQLRFRAKQMRDPEGSMEWLAADRIEAQAREIADLKRIIDGDTASLEAVEADNARLREALEPFAEAARKAEASGKPPFQFCSADDYTRAALARGGDHG